MALSEREIAQIAEASAQELINNLHRYPLTYRDPATVPQGLNHSMGEELTASNWYRQRAKHALSREDKTTAELYEHVAGEEDEHYQRFNERLSQIESGR